MLRASEMPQCIKESDAKSDAMRSVPRTCVIRGGNQLLMVVL